MFLVLGNHDVHRLDYYYNLGFKGIYERIIDNKHKWTFSHQPFNGDSSISDYINLHGHIHEETRYPKGIKNLSTEINCWSGYCTDGKVKTIREWLSFGNTIRNTYLEGVLLDDSYDTVSEMQVRESYSTIGMYVEETDSRYEFIKFPNPRTDKYLENDQECKKYLDTLKKDCIGEIIVDTNSDELAGYVFVNNKKDKGFIFNLIVIPKYRKQGLGRTLINDAVNKLHGVDLTVNKDNTVAVNLYKSNGFVIVGDGNSNKEYYMKLKSKLTKDDKVIDEAVSMDDDGNMLIYRATLNTINYGDEIKKSADLCKLYKESSNLDGLKYELCKLWYINAMLEKRIKRNDSKKDEYMANRRICLNVFKTYMKHVLVLDDDFNFVAFYNTTPFSGAIRIDKNTLKYSVKALKELMR